MGLESEYQQRIDLYRQKVKELRKKSGTFAFLRLLAAIAGVTGFYFTFAVSIPLAIIVLLFFIIVFIVIAKQDLQNTDLVNYYRRLQQINENELKSLDGNQEAFPDGTAYTARNHPYTSDLDIFGKASLFQYINRSTSETGSDTLAQWLKAPAPKEEIKLRQEAIVELKPMLEWRQDFQARGLKYKQEGNNLQYIIDWLKEEALFLNDTALKIVCTILPFITLAAIIASFYTLPNTIAWALAVVQFSINRRYSKKVEQSYHHTSNQVNLFKTYAELIEAIEKENFKSAKLKILQSHFELENGSTASAGIQQLAQLVNYLDVRLNILVHIFLNTLFFWDIHWIIRLEKWKKANHHRVEKWFGTLGEFEALSGMGNLYYNNPEWVMPEIKEEHFIAKGSDLGHPLISKEKRVSNPISIAGTGKLMLITGSNMAGKSTYLRTIGVNMVLAMAGAPVCAKDFSISRVTVFTSMRISDSLEENASSFYAELKRLETIIKTVERGEKIFFLLDEILRGTNSNDRHIGSKALIKQMIKHEGVGIIATHDLELGKLREELPGKIDNYSFDVQIENDQLFFDYKLKEGICKSLNASLLMKKMGIEVE